MRYRRLVLGVSTVTLAVFAGVGAVGSSASAASPSGVLPRDMVARGASAPVVSAPVVSAPSPAVPGPAATGGNPPDPDLALKVAQWVTNGGEDNLKALAVDFKDLEDAANTDDLPTISSSCAQLQTDVEAAQSYDAIPDPEAQHNWSAALADYERGATDCVAGADTSNADLITKASTEITDGSTALNLVTTRLGQIAG